MEILRQARPYEDVYFDDPSENPDTPRYRVWFDDESIEATLGKVANAIDRAQSLDRKLREAETPEQRDEVTQMMVHLEKRVIVAFIGAEGYDALLEWMGGGEAVDPARCTSMLGEVMGSLLTMLGRKATNEQLRRCGLYYSQESAKTKAFMQAQRKGSMEAVHGGKKKRRK